MATLQLRDASLTFKVRRHPIHSFKELVLNWGRHRELNPVVEIRALAGLSFAAADGDRLGVIGHNGAGKSTLLRLLAGVYVPTAGSRKVEGMVSSLMDYLAGLRADATGRENIVLRGYLQGETPKSMREKMPHIAKFSELGQHLDMPVRYYSAGMLVRLGFSVATEIAPEILLVDEVLSAGDVSFQAKARQRILQLINQTKILVLISHDLEQIRLLCNRVLWLDRGRIRMLGSTAEVLLAYRENASLTESAAA